MKGMILWTLLPAGGMLVRLAVAAQRRAWIVYREQLIE
jgi:hypothetical protein